MEQQTKGAEELVSFLRRQYAKATGELPVENADAVGTALMASDDRTKIILQFVSPSNDGSVLLTAFQGVATVGFRVSPWADVHVGDKDRALSPSGKKVAALELQQAIRLFSA